MFLSVKCLLTPSKHHRERQSLLSLINHLRGADRCIKASATGKFPLLPRNLMSPARCFKTLLHFTKLFSAPQEGDVYVVQCYSQRSSDSPKKNSYGSDVNDTPPQTQPPSEILDISYPVAPTFFSLIHLLYNPFISILVLGLPLCLFDSDCPLLHSLCTEKNNFP